MKGMTREQFIARYGIDPDKLDWFDPEEVLKALDKGEEPSPISHKENDSSA